MVFLDWGGLDACSETLYQTLSELGAPKKSDVGVPAKSVGTRLIHGFWTRERWKHLAVSRYSTHTPPTPLDIFLARRGLKLRCWLLHG